MTSPADFSDDFEMEAWLQSLGLEQYGEVFRQQGITRELLPTLSDVELREIGIEIFGHRKTLLLAIGELTAKTAADSDPATALTPGKTLFPLPNLPTAGFFPLPTDLPTRDHEGDAIAPPEVDLPEKPSRWSWKRFGGKFLFVSIAIHLLFGIGATVFVVQSIQAKRKITFQAGPKSPNPSQRAVEHKVSLAKKQNAMSAPAQAKRITSTSASKITLPAMPEMPKMDDFVPTQMAGLGGTGVGPSFGGVGGAGGGTGGSGMTLFGFRTSEAGGIRGDFYDLKQTKDGKPSGLKIPDYVPIISSYIKKGFNDADLEKYYKAPNPLYAGQIFIPDIAAEQGPQAFGVEKLVTPTMWMVVYKGKVVAPDSGQFRFVGIGDDVLAVKFKDRIVLDHGSYPLTGWSAKKKYFYDPSWLLPGAREWYGITGGHAVGDEFQVDSGRSYDIEIVMGEHPGGAFAAQILIEKIGGKYDKDPKGNPILPIFRMAKNKNPDPAMLPPFSPDGPIWTGSSSNKSKLGFGR